MFHMCWVVRSITSVQNQLQLLHYFNHFQFHGTTLLAWMVGSNLASRQRTHVGVLRQLRGAMGVLAETHHQPRGQEGRRERHLRACPGTLNVRNPAPQSKILERNHTCKFSVKVVASNRTNGDAVRQSAATPHPIA
jgi:hypothetical protein